MSLLEEIDDLFYPRSLVKKSKAAGISLRKGYGLRNLLSAASKAPQVVIKIPRRKGNSKGLRAVKSHLDYLSRYGKLKIEDQDGLVYLGKNGRKDIIEDLKGYGIAMESKKREAINFVFSMPPGTPPLLVKDAVRKTAEQEFHNHLYYFTLHTDDAHPHVHLCVLLKGRNGKRLNPRKNDLQRYRIRFADHLRELGVECTATPRCYKGLAKSQKNNIFKHVERRKGQEKSREEDIALKGEVKDTVSKRYRAIINKLRDSGNYREAAQVSELYESFNQNTSISTPSRLSQNQNQEQEVSRDL